MAKDAELEAAGGGAQLQHALELAEQLGWALPDLIFYPTGGGTGLIGMWKAFDELRRLGWLDDPGLTDLPNVDESVVRAIFRFVLPIAIVMHCYTASTLFDDLHTGTDIMTNYTVYEAFNQAVIRYVT